jgi:glycosyltransferase involved in cell wall biosynthesis
VVCGGATTFASPGDYGPRVIEQLRAQPNVEFLDQVAPERAHEIMASAALLLSTSDTEGFPNTFLEAWASGTPKISLSVDPDQVIEREELGGVLAGDVAAAARLIGDLVASPARRTEIGCRARQYVAAYHSEDAVCREFQRAIAGCTA